MKKILHTEKMCYQKASLQLLQNHFEVDYLETSSQSEFQVQLMAHDYIGIFTKLGLYIGAQELKAVPNLQYIITPTTGHNHLDLAALKKHGIQLFSLKGETEFLRQITSTAEHTWGLLLTLVRNMIPATTDVEAGNWRRKPFMGFDLYQKSIGIIGYGRLGKIIAQYAHSFGMKILANDINPQAFHQKPDWVRVVSLENLLQEVNIISLHIPYSKANHHFLDQTKFDQMALKPYFINTSRGEVVSESALLNALKTGVIQAAGLDVLEGDSSWSEKSPEHHELITYAKEYSNLLISPHMGGYGDNSIYNTRAFITHKFLKALNINIP